MGIDEIAAGPPAELLLLGRPRVRHGTAQAEVPETAPAYLGVYLAAQPGWVGRETLAAMLWPELPAVRAQHNLRVALNRLQALLERWSLAGTLHAERRRVRLDAPGDLARLRDAVAQGDWARAASLPQGVLLDGLQFASYPALAAWLEVEREAVRRTWRRALYEAAGTVAGTAPGGSAIDDAAARYLAAHPADGEMAALLAARLTASGRAAMAQDVIDGFRRAAAGELTPQEIEAAIGPIAQTTSGVAAALPTAEADGAPLGRAPVLRELDQAVAAPGVVTLVGLPGSGKSTVLRAWWRQRRGAAAASGEPRTLLLELTERSSAASLADAIVAALVVRPPPRGAPLAQRLSAASGLLVIDGIDPALLDREGADLLEHLAHVARVGTALQVVLGSRRALGVPGERVLRLGGLDCEAPVSDGSGDGSGNRLSDAALLLLREGGRVRASARWGMHGAAAERIARVTGGLPLALRLAAAWSRWLEPPAVAEAIERGARGASGALDPTLHDTIAPLWRRLAPAQRSALGALALFPRGFDFAAAVAVGGVPASDVEALVDACLVDERSGAVDAADASDRAAPRLQLHALVRRFAEARLRDDPAAFQAAVPRFLAQVHALLGPHAVAEGQPLFEPAPVARHLDEVLAAWALAREGGQVAALGWLQAALLTWHEAHGRFAAGAERLAEAVAALDESVPAEAAVLARVQAGRATLVYRQGDHDEAARLAREARRLGVSSGQGRVVRRATNTLGLALWMRMRLAEAAAEFEAGLAAALDAGDTRGEKTFTSNLALVCRARGDDDGAERGWRRAIELDRAQGDWQGACSGLNNLGNLLREQRRFDECEAVAGEALRLAREHDLAVVRPFALVGLALLQHARGRADEALGYLELLDGCDPADVEPAVRCGAAQLRAAIALDRADGSAALAAIAAALELALAAEDIANRGEALAMYGRWLAAHGGQAAQAERLWATLLHDTGTHASLRNEVRGLLARTGRPLPAGLPDPPADLALAAEQALAVARARR